MVHLLDDGAPPTGEAVDQGETPERPGAVERGLPVAGGEVVEIAVGGAFGQAIAADVEVDVEARVVLPHRRSQAAEAGDDALTQAGDGGHGPGHLPAEPLEVGWPIEEGHVGEGRAEVWVLLEVPHECLEVTHAAFSVYLPFRHGTGGYGVATGGCSCA